MLYIVVISLILLLIISLIILTKKKPIREAEFLPQNVPRKFVDNRRKKIPTIITKIFINNDSTLHVSKPVADSVRTWIYLNPEYEVRIFNTNNCIQFLKENFHPRYLQAFMMVKPYAYKCDLMRLCCLYAYGGVYSDIRQILLKPLRDIIKPDIDFMSPNDLQECNSVDHPLSNSFIASSPRHPFVKKAMDRVTHNILRRFHGTTPLDITGPTVLGSAVRSVAKGMSGPFKPGVYNWEGGKYEILKFSKTIKQDDKPIIIIKIGENIFTSVSTKGNSYAVLWNKGDIYH